MIAQYVDRAYIRSCDLYKYQCTLCGFHYWSREDAGEHLRRGHQVWDCGDFSVKVVPA